MVFTCKRNLLFPYFFYTFFFFRRDQSNFILLQLVFFFSHHQNFQCECTKKLRCRCSCCCRRKPTRLDWRRTEDRWINQRNVDKTVKPRKPRNKQCCNSALFGRTKLSHRCTKICEQFTQLPIRIWE